MDRPLRLGTRGSPLALAQAHMVAGAIAAAYGQAAPPIEIVTILSSGDRIQDRPLAEVGGKALWTKELDRALLDGDIDFAVHSMKDVETVRPERIGLAAMLPRADVRDRLIGAESVAALPYGARIGTSAPRRAAQLRRLRPDVDIVLFRGNVATRLAKLAAGEAQATLLAAAGLDRLGQGEVGHAVPIETMLPAASQGAVGIEALLLAEPVWSLIRAIDHQPTHRCVEAERAVLAALGADCRSPVATLAVLEDNEIHLRAEILTPDGVDARAGAVRFDWPEGGYPDEPAALARALLSDAPPALRELFTGA